MNGNLFSAQGIQTEATTSFLQRHPMKVIFKKQPKPKLLITDDMKLANIPSKKPFYVSASGLVINHKKNEVKGYLSNATNVLSYENTDGVVCKIPFPRLIYTTFNPKENITGCKIFRINTDTPQPYALNNLIVVKNSLMPCQNNLPQAFYKDFDPIEKQNLITLMTSKSYPTKRLATKHDVCMMTIFRAKKRLVNAVI